MKKHRILIIEHDEAIAETQRLYLENAGLSVAISKRGDLGLRKAIAYKPHLIIFDLALPGINGFDVCRMLRDQVDAIVVIISERDSEPFKIECFELGAVDYLLKPFSPLELTARVKAHLAQYDRMMRTSEKQEIVFDGIKITLNRREVFRDGVKVDLANKEYELLVFLINHTESCFNKDKLYKEVWGRERRGDLKTVAVHIKRLRDKLEKDPAKPRHIVTYPGLGYRFEA